jgi:AcrR family transcriptional regulator
MATSSTPRPLRSDAARNRAALVKTAADAFREDGLGVSVNEIARRADVNIATLYRHFPTKDHLVDAVLGGMLEPISGARDLALATPEGGDVLDVFIREAARLQGDHRGLVEALSNQGGVDVRGHLRGPAVAMAEPVAERAHRDGTLRADFDAEDLLCVLQMISVVTTSAERASKPVSRYVDLALRGLR